MMNSAVLILAVCRTPDTYEHFDAFYLDSENVLFSHFTGTFHTSNNSTCAIVTYQVVAKQQTLTTGTRTKCTAVHDTPFTWCA